MSIIIESLTNKEVDKIIKLFEYNNYSIRNLEFLLNYINNTIYIHNKAEFIKTDLTLFEEIYQDKLWYHEKDEYYYQLSSDKYLNMTLIYENIRKFIKSGLIIDNDKKYKNYLEVGIDYMESLSNDYYITSYISDYAYDVAGYCTIRGKIYYDEYDYEKFDFYEVKAWTRNQTHEYRRRILNRIKKE